MLTDHTLLKVPPYDCQFLPQVLDTHDGMGVDDIESLVSVSNIVYKCRA